MSKWGNARGDTERDAEEKGKNSMDEGGKADKGEVFAATLTGRTASQRRDAWAVRRGSASKSANL